MTPNHEAEQLRLLREIARNTKDTASWAKEAVRRTAREEAGEVLDTDAKRRAYEAIAGGSNTLTAIGKLSGANPSRDIKPWISDWAAEGFVEQGSNPPRATFTLKELGIDPPAAKASRNGRSSTGGSSR